MPYTTYTPATAPSYASASDVQAAAGKKSMTGAETTAATAMVADASRYVDQATNRWFYLRNLQVKTEAPGDGRVRLFLPAPIVSLTSVTEDDADLDVTTDVVIYPSAIEKTAPLPVTPTWNQPLAPWWSMNQQAVVVTGIMGYTAVPADIKRLVAQIAAVWLGWQVRQYVNNDGVVGEVQNGQVIPAWAKVTIDNWTVSTFHGQTWVLTDVS